MQAIAVQDAIISRVILLAAMAAHEANVAYCRGIGDFSQPERWDEAPDWQQKSAVSGVRFVLEHPDAGPEAQHESWLTEKRRDGWVYGPVKNAQQKIHPCFRPYSELPYEQRAKDAIFGAVVRGVLVHHGLLSL